MLNKLFLSLNISNESSEFVLNIILNNILFFLKNKLYFIQILKFFLKILFNKVKPHNSHNKFI
jgi:hypothetical protein